MYDHFGKCQTLCPSHSTNIKGTSVLGGKEGCPYLPPIPPQGSGYHRYIFAVYSHTEPLPSDLLPSSGNW